MEGHSSVWLLITIFKQFSPHSIIYIIIVIQDTCVDYSLTTHFVSVVIQSSLGDFGHIIIIIIIIIMAGMVVFTWLATS